MRPIEHIRRNIFRIGQIEMAKIAGVSQATISRWEKNVCPASGAMARIRDEAVRRAIPWDDRWFFEAPVEAAE